MTKEAESSRDQRGLLLARGKGCCWNDCERKVVDTAGIWHLASQFRWGSMGLDLNVELKVANSDEVDNPNGKHDVHCSSFQPGMKNGTQASSGSTQPLKVAYGMEGQQEA